MSDVVLYTKSYDPYSRRALQLLEEYGVAFDNIDVTEDTTHLGEMMQLSGGKQTVPQIFICGRHIGGLEDLIHLDETGVLENMLGERDVDVTQPSS